MCPRSQGKGRGADSPAERILEMGKQVASCHGVAAFEQPLMRGWVQESVSGEGQPETREQRTGATATDFLSWSELRRSGLLPFPPRFAAGIWRLPFSSLSSGPSTPMDPSSRQLSIYLLTLQMGKPRPGGEAACRVEVPGFQTRLIRSS